MEVVVLLMRTCAFKIYFLLIVVYGENRSFVRHVSLDNYPTALTIDRHQSVDWSILICNLPSRVENLCFLVNKLKKQIEKVGLIENIEILVFIDIGEHATGFKRNVLLKQSCGKYVSFIDDDDDVSDNYVSLIYEKIKCDPDVIALKTLSRYSALNKQVECLFVRSIKRKKLSNSGGFIGLKFTLPLDTPILKKVYLLPIMCSCVNHLNPIRRDIALKCLFPDQVLGEDTEYAMRLLKSNLLKSELEVGEILYYYNRRVDSAY